MELIQTFGLGPSGWGESLLRAAGTTLLTAVLGFLLGTLGGAGLAWAKLAGRALPRQLAEGYTTVVRGVPALLVIYLIYFGGSSVVTAVGALVAGKGGFIGLPPFPTGVLALAIVAAAYMAEVLRGAYLAIPRGQFEAAQAIGMSGPTMLWLITVPLTLRHALAGLGNVWQMVLKESALLSVVGLTDLMGAAQVGAGSTSEPFAFFAVAGVLYLAIASASGVAFRLGERRTLRGERGR